MMIKIPITEMAAALLALFSQDTNAQGCLLAAS